MLKRPSKKPKQQRQLKQLPVGVADVSSAGRVETGIPGFDMMIGGGMVPASFNLLSGSAGTGKSTFALQFLYYGAKEKDEPGIYISLEREPSEIIEHMKKFGWKVDKLIEENKLRIIKPDLAKFETLKNTIADEVDHFGAKRLVINPFSLITAYFANVYDVRRALSDLRGQVNKLGCTTIVVSDIKEDEKILSSTGYEEFVVSGVILLGFSKKDPSTFVRTILVRKMEETNHSLKLVPMEIGSEGITVYPNAEVF